MLIIFTQKPSFIDSITNMLDKHIHEEYVCFSSFCPFQSCEGIASDIWMNIPKKISYTDIPYFQNPTVSLKRKSLFTIATSSEKEKKVDNIDPNLLNNNEYIYIGDNEGHYLLNFVNFINVLGKPNKISMTNLTSMTEKDLLYSFQNRKDFNFSSPELNIASINRKIDYLFFINGLVLFNDIRKKSLNPQINNISKEDIQILYKIRDNDLDFINGFQGSKKYNKIFFPLSIDNYHYMHLSLIDSNLNKLNDLGFINYKMSQIKHSIPKLYGYKTGQAHFTFEPKITLNELGYEFLDFLHPDCKDYDIFGRIISWKDLPKNIADNKVEKYIKFYFGKQKQYMYKNKYLNID
jgi:hypothetical protein